MANSPARFLVVNGVPHSNTTSIVPPVASLLESIPGAYTTTRTHLNGSLILFWEQHLRRLANSARILAEHSRRCGTAIIKATGVSKASCESIRPLVEESVGVGLSLAIGKRSDEEEVAITAIIKSRGEEEGIGGGPGGVDVFVHSGSYVPLGFGVGARLAVVGRGREVAEAKYSEWARIRKYMEKLRPPLATELLLSNDGDCILEGSVTNFFVVCRKAIDAAAGQPSSNRQRKYSFEVQTAPLCDGVLPGVIRQLVIEVCSSKGIPIHEVAPRWSNRELWEEAFVTNSLRLLQHVDMIQAPKTWGELQSESWRQVLWVEKQFEVAGPITIEIQKAIMERANASGHLVSNYI